MLRKSRLFFLSLFIGTFAFTPPAAHAQSCYEKCQNQCRNMEGFVMQGCVDNCNRAYCSNNNVSQPRPFGAIAFGDHGMEGISWNKGTQGEADMAAIASCAEHGTNCKVVYRYRDTCAALSVAKGAVHFESATGATAKDAEAQANALCQKNWGVLCASNMSACSLTGARPAAPPPAPKAISWGAIAYSPTEMAAGTSIGKSDRAAAEREAMTVCAQRGKSCVVQTAFNKSCGAVAADRTVAGAGTSADQREAQQKAVEACTKAGGVRCVLHVAICSN
jgi:hypothetical protein